MELIKPQSSSHWYNKDSTPCFEIIGKNGKPRAPNVKDARELSLLPSVTTILGIIANPTLDAWKNSQLIMAALTLPKLEGESSDAYARRVIDDSKEQSMKAAAKGTSVHAAIEVFVKTGKKEIEDFDFMFDELAGFGLVGTFEKRFANEKHGYAGTIDFYGFLSGNKSPWQKEYVIADFKTQATKDGKYKVYDTWKYQLCAYAVGALESGFIPPGIEPMLCNIVISSTEKGVWLYKYTIEEIRDSIEIFMNAKNIFYLTKGLKRPWIERENGESKKD
jgi:hypothetical protein